MARLVVLLWCCLMSPAWSAERVSVRADEWFPVNGQPDSARPGFAIELLAQVFAAPEFELDYQLLDWQRALELVNTGATDCVLGAYKSEAPGLLFPRFRLPMTATPSTCAVILTGVITASAQSVVVPSR